MLNKIAPEINQLIQPIVFNMTRIHLTEEQQKNTYGQFQEPPEWREEKKKCVHILFNGSGYDIAASYNSEGKLMCKCCGREINTKFDNDAYERLVAAIPVLNQLTLFGLIHGLKKPLLQNIILLKQMMPDAAQLMKSMNEFVKNETTRMSAQDNVGAEYQSETLFGQQLTGLR